MREAAYVLCPFMDEFSTTTKVCLIHAIDNQERRVTQSMNAAELYATRNIVNEGNHSFPQGMGHAWENNLISACTTAQR